MKTRLTFIVILLALCSCGKETPQIEYLEVNRNNISGSWKLDSWNSEPMLEGSYFYINLVRNDGTYTIRQNLDGFPESGRTITGSYDLRDEEGVGTIISGLYDHDSGFWSHEYIIRKLTADSMEWTALDDGSFIQTFSRTDGSVFE